MINIAGGLRSGKSFLQNFFIRKLKSGNEKNWMESDGKSLEGFSWRSGINPETKGILMWSEPFVVKAGEREIAVILADSEGIFDNDNTREYDTKIFTMAQLTSSVLACFLKSFSISFLILKIILCRIGNSVTNQAVQSIQPPLRPRLTTVPMTE